jgi:formate--tetrahydrofolate ligase
MEVPVSVAINHFITDTDNELSIISECCDELGIKSFNCTHWSNGGAGAETLAQHIVDVTTEENPKIKHLYPR